MPNQSPVVTGSNHTYNTGQQIAVSSLFSASDPDGSVATYSFYDSTAGAGYFTLDGAHISGTSISVSAANLSRVGYFTGPNGGTNDIACDVLDNLGAISNTKTITITVQATTDAVHQGIATTDILSTSRTGTINAEPMSGDIAISLADGSGGYVDKDWYQVTLNQGNIYTFSGSATSITTGLMDISLYSLNGTQVHIPVEGVNPSFTFDTTYQTSATQTYYLAASTGGTDPAWKTATGNYLVSLSVQTATTSDHIPESTSSTVPLPLGTTLGTIDSTDISGGPDDDYYKVTLTGGDKYTFIASAGVSSTDTLDSVIIRLRDSGGNILSTGDKSSSGATPSFDYVAPGSGPQTYYLAISASNAGSNNGIPTGQKTGQYSISVVDSGSAPANSSTSNDHRIGAVLEGTDSLFAYHLTPDQITAAGKQFVIRYIGGPDPTQAKYFDSVTAKALIDAHLSVVSVFERHILYDSNGNATDSAPTNTSYFTAQQADADAQAALAGAVTAGQPAGSAIYFSVDVDPGTGASGAAH